MANRYLLPVYAYIFDEPFNYSSFQQRLKMQKVIYLLQEMGVPVGDYGFSWYKHGPYSQRLLDDAFFSRDNGDDLDLNSLTSDNRRAINKLKEILSVPNSKYDVSNWCECIASIHYLRQKMLPRSCSDQDVLFSLERRKPHLNDHAANEAALNVVNYLFA